MHLSHNEEASRQYRGDIVLVRHMCNACTRVSLRRRGSSEGTRRGVRDGKSRGWLVSASWGLKGNRVYCNEEDGGIGVSEGIIT